MSEREVSPQRLCTTAPPVPRRLVPRQRRLRRFALDAVREAKLLETKAKNVPVRELEAALDAGYGIYGGGGDAKVRWATLLFDADAAQWWPTRNGIRSRRRAT